MPSVVDFWQLCHQNHKGPKHQELPNFNSKYANESLASIFAYYISMSILLRLFSRYRSLSTATARTAQDRNNNLGHSQHNYNSPRHDIPGEQNQEQPAIDLLRKHWNEFSSTYAAIDSCPQTFFFTLISMLKIHRSSNILQIACGAGLLLPFVIDIKQPHAQYVATDLSSDMLAIAHGRLRSHLQKYESKLTLQEWMKKHKLILKEANGQEPILGFGKFDTVICNLVLMLAINPKNILASVHKTTTDNALMGITIWGDKFKSTFMTLVGRAIKAVGLPVPNKRSPFYYQQNIYTDLQETGWQIVLEWQQNAPLPYSEPNDIDQYLQSLTDTMSEYSPADEKRIKAKAKEMYIESINSHTPLQMHNKLLVVRKIR